MVSSSEVCNRSGYPSALYDRLYAGWRCETRTAYAEAQRQTTEALWISPAADEALRQASNPDDFALKVKGVTETGSTEWGDDEGENGPPRGYTPDLEAF